MIVESFTRTLSEVVVDGYEYKVTESPFEAHACILWFREKRSSTLFEALGQFSRFDKRTVLEFIASYSTSPRLREEIKSRKFKQRVEHLSPSFFNGIERMSIRAKEQAYRNLFNLESSINKAELDRRRRIMAKKFHPDAGGSNRHMAMINDGYNFLLSLS